jgi:hypothetical protein
MTRQQALLMEEKLALDLRRQGYAVGLIDFGNFEHHYFLQRMKKLIEIILMILVWLSFILVSLAIWRLVRHLIL